MQQIQAQLAAVVQQTQPGGPTCEIVEKVGMVAPNATAVEQVGMVAPNASAVEEVGMVAPMSSHAVEGAGGSAQTGVEVEDVFVARKRRRAHVAMRAELAQLCAEEKTRAKEDRVEVAGKKAFLQSMLLED